MAILSPARRLATFADLEREGHAGDYTGPHPVITKGGEISEVWFLLPVHRGETMYDRPDEGSGLHGVTSDRWAFRECPDGSLEIRPSIGCGPQPYYWHGYLDEGNTWRQV